MPPRPSVGRRCRPLNLRRWRRASRSRPVPRLRERHPQRLPRTRSGSSTPSTWVRLGTQVVDEVRRRVQQDTLGLWFGFRCGWAGFGTGVIDGGWGAPDQAARCWPSRRSGGRVRARGRQGGRSLRSRTRGPDVLGLTVPSANQPAAKSIRSNGQSGPSSHARTARRSGSSRSAWVRRTHDRARTSTPSRGDG
jgi:hypothetical protein